MKNWAVRIACSNEAGNNACTHPATSSITQARQVSTGKPKTVPQQRGRESGGGPYTFSNLHREAQSRIKA